MAINTRVFNDFNYFSTYVNILLFSHYNIFFVSFMIQKFATWVSGVTDLSRRINCKAVDSGRVSIVVPG